MTHIPEVEEVVERLLNHEAIVYADSKITLDAIRNGTKGYTGPSLKDAMIEELTTLISQARSGAFREALGVVKEQDFVADELTWGDTEYNSNAVRYGINLARENLSALTTEGE